MSAFVPWEARDGWTDVTPIPQADTAEPLVPINYSPEYVSAMSTFRWILEHNEISRRVLDLTAEIVKINPAHYTVWSYRSKTLVALKDSEPSGEELLVKELGILDELVKVHLKNYQVWQHRRIVVTALNDAWRELPFTTRALALDAKNYHTWAYRQWALSHFFHDSGTNADVWAKEVEFASSLLNADVRNNSAWNHRWFSIFARPEEASEETIDREIAYTKAKLALAPNNPSAWNYLRGILDRFSLSYLPHAQWAHALRSPTNPEAEVVLALEFQADAYAAGAETDKVSKIYDSLASELDPMRKGYWDWKKSLLQVSTAV